MHDSLDPKRLTCLPRARLLDPRNALEPGCWWRAAGEARTARPRRPGAARRCPPDHDRGDRPRVDRDRSDRLRAERRGAVRRSFVLRA